MALPLVRSTLPLILVKGGGDLGTGVAWRLHRAGFQVIVTELAQPLVVRRTVSFASAVYERQTTVEGITAALAADVNATQELLATGMVAVLVDATGSTREAFSPEVLIDAVIAKRNTGTQPSDAPLVIALGPGFTPSVDCHAVVETNRGHNLGRVYWDRAAEADTGIPGDIGGKTGERVLRAPHDGILLGAKQIGDAVARGDLIARVDGTEIRAAFDGILRGLVHEGLRVQAGMKVGDLDPRISRANCFTISDKSLAVGGGALEAVMAWLNRRTPIL